MCTVRAAGTSEREATEHTLWHADLSHPSRLGHQLIASALCQALWRARESHVRPNEGLAHSDEGFAAANSGSAAAGSTASRWTASGSADPFALAYASYPTSSALPPPLGEEVRSDVVAPARWNVVAPALSGPLLTPERLLALATANRGWSLATGERSSLDRLRPDGPLQRPTQGTHAPI